MRNPLCPYYSKCLTAAARIDGKLECSACEHENNIQQVQLTQAELAGCLALLDIVFDPNPGRDYMRRRW